MSSWRRELFAGGFGLRANLEGAKALGVERCVFSKSKGLSKEEMAGSRRTFGRLKKRRAGITGVISRLKQAFGLRRCTRRGWKRFQSYVLVGSRRCELDEAGQAPAVT